jgi:acetyl esterase/lipase
VSASSRNPTAEADEPGVVVAEHFVPVPRTVSPEAQAFLRSATMLELPPVPASREDKAGWEAYREAGNARLLKSTRKYADLYPADVSSHALSVSTLHEVTPRNLAPENARRAILYVHGGAFVFGGGQAAIYAAMQVAGRAATRVFAIDHRLLPDHPFPDPLEDVFESYRFLLDRYEASSLAVFGASAGANLAAACVLMARDRGLPLPAACAMHSGPFDIAEIGDTGSTLVGLDIAVKRPVPELPAYYADGHDPKDPYLSPVHADFTRGFAPSILTSGTRDMLLSNMVRMHRALVRGGVEAELHVWEAMAHAPFSNAPEADELYNQHVQFMLRRMGRSG